MGDDPLFKTQPDYEVPLLRLLARLPGGRGKTDDVCRQFEVEYGHRIPTEHYETKIGKEPKWRNNVRWVRKYLIERGFVETPRRGVWMVNDAGRRWLEENPGAARIPGSASSLVRKRRPVPIPKKTTPASPPGKLPSPDLTLEMLEQTRKTMPPEEFHKVWGALYAQLRAEDRAKAVTEVTQTELGRRARRHLDVIHGLLQGQNAGSPSAEAVCDWIHFCYAMELYREAAALLPYVHEGEVDPAVYRRTKRIAEVCRNKEG